MNYIHVFFTLVSEIVELLLAGWQVSVTLLTLIVLSLLYGSPLVPRHVQRKDLVLFIPLICTGLILVIGTLTAHHPHPQWTTWIILLLFLIQPLISLIITIGILEFRLSTVAVLALEVWVGLISCFIAAVNADGMRL